MFSFREMHYVMNCRALKLSMRNLVLTLWRTMSGSCVIIMYILEFLTMVVEFGLGCVRLPRGGLSYALPLLGSCLQREGPEHQADNQTWETHLRSSTAVAHSRPLTGSSSGSWVGTQCSPAGLQGGQWSPVDHLPGAYQKRAE